jgi:mono/diheme cytochrome c family protein
MRWTRWTPLTVSVVCIAAALALMGAAPAKDTNAARIQRGGYLATIEGCNDCHTPGTLYGAPDFSRRLSGSELGWRGPWGVSYPRNLTPDMETGIGSWTEKQIVDALRTGMRPNGKPLLPPMPWPNFTALTDEDAYALAAYLKSLPAVSHKVPDAVTPDQALAVKGSIIDFPAPSAWDAPRGPAGAAASPMGGTSK